MNIETLLFYWTGWFIIMGILAIIVCAIIEYLYWKGIEFQKNRKILREALQLYADRREEQRKLGLGK